MVGWDEGRVAWRSRTCGDWDGVVLELEGDEETALAFSSPTMSFRFTLGELAAETVERDGPLLEQRVVARRLSRKTGPSEASFEWCDDDPPEGTNTYWVWVTQTDGELAWSSPVFVDRRK